MEIYHHINNGLIYQVKSINLPLGMAEVAILGGGDLESWQPSLMPLERLKRWIGVGMLKPFNRIEE